MSARTASRVQIQVGRLTVFGVRAPSYLCGNHLLRAWCVLPFLLMLLGVPARAQTIQGTYTTTAGPSTLSQNQTIYIDPAACPSLASCPVFPMPEVAFTVSGVSSSDTVDWSVNAEYADQSKEYGTGYTLQATKAADEQWSVSWGDDVGGTITVEAVVYSEDGCGPPTGSATFTFVIKGETETADQVNGNMGSMPWFTGNMITEESCEGDDQFSPSNGFCSESENIAGDPLWNGTFSSTGTPESDGIGFMQVDHVKDPGVFTNCTYWNFICNMSSAYQVLLDDEGGAYTFWDSQMKQMCMWVKGTYSGTPGTGETTCSKVQQPGTGDNPSTGPTYPLGSADYYQEQSPLTYCSSHFTLSAGAASGWRDSEWIKAYNGAATYYIFWHPDTENPNTYQYWVSNNTSGPTDNNCVYNICNSAPY